MTVLWEIKRLKVQENIRQKIEEALAPTDLEIVDESHLHAGHTGARPEGETHFRISVVSRLFEGKSRVARQRLIYDVLKDELAGPVHALSLSTKTQDE